jgi:hypothetical protein
MFEAIFGAVTTKAPDRVFLMDSPESTTIFGVEIRP